MGCNGVRQHYLVKRESGVIQAFRARRKALDPRFRGDDDVE